MGTLCLLFLSKHVSVSLLFVNKQTVTWSFVRQYIIDMLFAPSHDDNEQFVKFHHYTLGTDSCFGCQPELLISCHPNEQQSAVCSPAGHCDIIRGLELAQISRQFSMSRTPRQRMVVRAHEKSGGQGTL